MTIEIEALMRSVKEDSEKILHFGNYISDAVAILDSRRNPVDWRTCGL